MGLMSFLKTGKVEQVTLPKGGGTKKQRNPNPGTIAIRVFADGSVYPSQGAVDKFNLAYPDAVITKEVVPLKEGESLPEGETQKTRNVYSFPKGTGNGLDVIDTDKCLQFKGLGKRLLFVAVVPKNAGKVDLFATTSYEDTGVPKSTVMDQGAKTFGDKELLSTLTEVYGIVLNTNEAEGPVKEFVDLNILEEYTEGADTFNITEHFSTPILFAPKSTSRGKDKGKDTYERRENAPVYLLAPDELLVPEPAATEAKSTLKKEKEEAKA